MKFACVAAVAPGQGLGEKCDAIARAGCSGVETIIFQDVNLELWEAELRSATSNAGLQPAAVILGGLALYRSGQLQWVYEAMAAIAGVGAAVLMTPEYRPQDPLPIFPPYPAPSLQEQGLVEQALEGIVREAKRLSVPLLLEPLTQFESRFWRSVDDVLLVCRNFDDPLVGICLDFHNMNITEANIENSVFRAGRYVRHVHLADSNRFLPGRGHINFSEGLHTLQQLGYDGWFSFECAIGEGFTVAVQDTIAGLRANYTT
jgi:sugar phosphate isomerase/epimerase